MSKTKYVEFKGNGFWAYDESLSILLALVIRLATPRAESDPNAKSITSRIPDFTARTGNDGTHDHIFAHVFAGRFAQKFSVIAGIEIVTEPIGYDEGERV